MARSKDERTRRNARGILGILAALLLAPPAIAGDAEAGSAGASRTHWSFQPVKTPPVPAVKDASWPRTEIDRFILARLEGAGLHPSPPADRRTLIRRAAFDLTGLPPSLPEVEAFENDASPGAFAKVIDRLLASPRYGERWGRYWLDVARYADSKGYVFTEERRFPFSYTYRDYVVRAFNQDLPYDRFILEQLAADLLELGEDRRPLAAMGFLTLGRRFLNNRHDIIDDRIDVTTRGLLGLSVTCARCHDHKYDPIPTQDYYSLYGVFASAVEPEELPLLSSPPAPSAGEAGTGSAEVGPETAAFEQELAACRRAVDEARAAEREKLLGDLLKQLPAYLLAARQGESRAREAGKPEFALSLSEGELRPQVVRRWREFLDRARSSGPQPVFAPWLAFAALPAGDFPARAAKISASVAAGDLDGPIHPLIAAVFRGEAPTSVEDAAGRYGELFANPDPSRPDLQELRRLLVEGEGPLSFADDREFERLLDRKARDRLRGLRKKVDQLMVTHPGAPPRAQSLVEAPEPHDPHVFVRGNPSNLGEAVPRRFLAVLEGENRVPFKEGSGRLEMARKIASRGNPLTARVLVNRVWMHHFGSGLVGTPSDFGIRGDLPTHPALLDYLASRFMEEGWSVKNLHRLILLSSVWQQQGGGDDESRRRDPENRLYSRMNRRRLDFESMRDALLWAAGRLDSRAGGRPVDLFSPPYSNRRAIYGFIDRQNLPGLLRSFDFASPDTSCPRRHQTAVPQQALFLMNSPFVLGEARHLAARPEVAGAADPRERIRALYRIAYDREPEEGEMEMGLRFVAAPAAGAAGDISLWERYAQVLLLSNEFHFID